VTEFLGPICAFMASVTWAIGSSHYSRLSKSFTPFSVNFTRAAVALPLFIAVALITGGFEAYSHLRPSHLGWFTLSVISSYGLGDVLFLWSTLSLGVPGALAIASSYPLQAALLEAVILGRPLAPFQIFGLLLTVGGVITVILNTPKMPVERLFRTRSSGIILAFATSVLWMLNSYAVAKGGVDLAAPVSNTVRMGLTLIIAATLSRFLAQGQGPLLLPFPTLKKNLWVFVFEGFGGAYVFVYGLAHSPLVIGAALSSLAPVLAVPVAVAMGLEKLSFFRTLGVVMVVIGLRFLM
jgi:drug/metabolite transporter (DMT)-like permease